jgi:hypothetical protein
MPTAASLHPAYARHRSSQPKGATVVNVSTPDTTNEGWNSWPTERVSHALVRDQRAHARIGARATAEVARAPADIAAFRLAPVIRETIEDLLGNAAADELRESLVTFALSRVDWLQLAEAAIEATVAEDEALVVGRTAA